MSREQKLSVKIEFWTSPEQLEGLKLLTSDGLSDRSVHIRQALTMYLRQFGINCAPRPAQSNGNGQHHPQEQRHGV